MTPPFQHLVDIRVLDKLDHQCIFYNIFLSSGCSRKYQVSKVLHGRHKFESYGTPKIYSAGVCPMGNNRNAKMQKLFKLHSCKVGTLRLAFLYQS